MPVAGHRRPGAARVSGERATYRMVICWLLVEWSDRSLRSAVVTRSSEANQPPIYLFSALPSHTCDCLPIHLAHIIEKGRALALCCWYLSFQVMHPVDLRRNRFDSTERNRLRDNRNLSDEGIFALDDLITCSWSAFDTKPDTEFDEVELYRRII
jgi:hypothetical protein